MENKRYESISFGLFLLSVGTVALLANLQILAWRDLLDFVLRYWPVFIISAGVKMVGNAHLGKFFGIIFDVLFFAAVILGIVFVKQQLLGSNQNTIKLDIVTENVPFERYTDAMSVDYDFNFGAADFLISDKVSGNYLSMTGPDNFRISENLTSEKVLRIDTKNIPLDKYYRIASLSDLNTYKASLGVSEIPAVMSISTGASKGVLTLDEMRLKSFTSQVGAGELSLDLSGLAVAPKIELSVGAGKTTLRLHGDKTIKLTYSLGAGSVKLKSEKSSLDKDFGGIGANGVYEMSPTYDVEVTVNVGAGAVEIVLD